MAKNKEQYGVEKNKAIIIDLLGSDYKAIVCWGSKKFVDGIAVEWGYKSGIVEIGDKDNACIYNYHGLQSIIILKEPPKTPLIIGALAHEADHLVDDIFEYIGEKPQLGSEIHAYLVARIVEQTLKYS